MTRKVIKVLCLLFSLGFVFPQHSATGWNCGWKRSENCRQILQIWQHDWAEMCNQQNTATNKLCYLETRFENVELWHESRRNQVGEPIVLCSWGTISTFPPSCTSLCVPIIPRCFLFSVESRSFSHDSLLILQRENEPQLRRCRQQTVCSECKSRW